MAGRVGKRKKKQVQRSFEEWYADAAAYARDNGDLLVPFAYVTPEGRKLGRWIDVQRRKHNRPPGTQRIGWLTETEAAMLEGIGMVWKVKEQHSFQEWTKAAARYYQEKGDLLVPVNYRDGGYGLGSWIQEMRKKHAEGKLKPWQVEELEGIGMVWSLLPPKRRWADWYEDAKAYYKSHGHLLVPKGFRTAHGDRLGVWLGIQRGRYWGTWKGRAPLTPEETELLDQLHMKWEIRGRRRAKRRTEEMEGKE